MAPYLFRLIISLIASTYHWQLKVKGMHSPRRSLLLIAERLTRRGWVGLFSALLARF